MKKLSDYKDEEAIDLWADLFDPFSIILSDKKIAEMLRARKAPIFIASDIVKRHKAEAKEIILRIDDTPINGLNLMVRLMELLTEISKDPTMQSFFGLSAEAQKEEKLSGSALENTEASGNPDTSSDM